MTRSLFSIVCFIGAVALFFLYTKPAYDGLVVHKKEIVQYDLALDKAAELQRLKQTLLSRFNSFDPIAIERLRKLLPDHVDNVRLILDLDTLASQHGLALQNLVISTPQKKDAESETIVSTTDTTGYDSLTLGFGTIGTYPAFVIFLTDLEKSLRIVDVEQLKISAATVGAAGSEPQYRFDIILRTYWLK